jgi:TetR/AcrR family transcriptional regulator, mexJK operon transcriptional repressor
MRLDVLYDTVHIKAAGEKVGHETVTSEDADAMTRPRRAARRHAFLEAATAVFLEKGYANATLDDVIARSGGSRQTLYSLFGGKQGLFEALITERSGKIFAPFSAEDLLDRTPDEVLVEVGVRYLETVMTPDTLGFHRLVVAEGVFMKELAERFWEMGPAHTRALLASYFEQQTRRGALRLHDPEQAAQQFWGMLLGSFQMQCLLGLREAPGSEEIEAFVRTAVAWFLDGCRAGKG